ncbi:MAG: type II secretion system F family protein [Burkholderiales bacterium]|nr:type II secretion system F family protein [Burkholderiales bacterium]
MQIAKAKKDPTETAITWGPFGNIPDKDILMFMKKISTMVRSGLTLMDSLIMVSSQTKNVILRGVINKLIKDVNQGIPLSDAFKKHPRYFDEVLCNMIEAGEISGQLDIFLDRITESMEKTQKIRSGIKSALFYPVTLVVVTLLIMWGMLVFVVPTFVAMYSKNEKGLPVPTQMLVTASEFITNGQNVLELFIIIIVVVTTHKLTKKYFYPYRALLSQIALKLPLFGNIIVKSTVSRLALLMANLFAAGIGVSEILKIAKKITTNVKFTEALERIAEGVVTGTPVSVLFDEEPVFPKDLSQLMKVGESTGNMDEMLTSIARYYQEEFESTVEGLTSMLEPLMIVFVGGMIGLTVVALYLPIFSQGDMI